MARLGAVLLLVSALGGAPMQCVGEPDPAQQREESPAEALYGAAEELGRAGDAAGRRRVLQYLVDRYPSSRFAVRAREELDGGTPPP